MSKEQQNIQRPRHHQPLMTGIKREGTEQQQQQKPNTIICEHCGKTFLNQTTLRRHQAVHSKEKPFQCNFCNFASRWKGEGRAKWALIKNPVILNAMSQLKIKNKKIIIN